MASIKTIVLAMAGLSALSSNAHSQNYAPNQVGMAMMRLNASHVDIQQQQAKFAQGSVWNQLRSEFRMAEVNPELVRRHEMKFAAGSAYFNRTIDRSKPYMYHITKEVAKRNMPAEIALLPFIESAYVTKAKSHVGASGLWQFMPATGRHYGLEQTPLYDGRHDVYASTNAALNYLEYLHGLFGDWSLALAAYNWGEGNVGRAINRARAQGLTPTYENLRMPAETRNYVPKLLAVRNIVNNPQYFGMNLAEIDNKPHFKAVSLDQPIDVSAVARLAQINESEFLALNPAFKVPVYIPKANRKMLLPAHAAATFERNYNKADKASLLSWDVYTPYVSTSVASIAAETGMSVAELKSLNGMRDNRVSAGRSVLVAKNSFGKGNVAANQFASIDADTNPHDNKLQVVPDMGQGVSNVAIAQAMPQRVEEPARIVVAQAKAPEVAPVVVAKEKTAPALTPTVNIVTTPNTPVTTLATKEPLPLPINTVENQKVEIPPLAQALVAPEASKPVAETIAIKEPLPLPTQTAAVAKPVASGAETVSDDVLFALIQDTSLQASAAESVKQALAEEEAKEAAAQARAAKLAEARAKQQQRTEARLARAQAQAQQVAAASQAAKAAPSASGTHRVDSGDTLFNIAQRYNISVADLVTANNIQGNSIRKGQVLKVAAVKAKTKTNAAHTKTVANNSSNKAANVKSVSYTVRKGDTLNDIARRFNMDVKEVRRLNNNSSVVRPGQNIKLMGS